MSYVSAEHKKAVALSRIGKLACRVRLAEGEVLIALRVHIDGSGKTRSAFDIRIVGD
jgi:hypothetical protein